MIVNPLLHRHHLPKSSDDVQLASVNAPCSSAAHGRYPASLSLQAGHLPREGVTCPSQQAASLPASQATKFGGVEVERYGAHADLDP